MFKCPPSARTQARKRVCHWSTASSISDCSKPRHTWHTPHATTVRAVGAHRCHTHVAEWQTVAQICCHRTHQTIWSVIQLDAACNILTVHYKDMKCDVSFSLGSVSTLFRWGGHFCHMCVKQFFLLTTVQNYKKIYHDIPVLPHFYSSRCIYIILYRRKTAYSVSKVI